MRKKEKKKKQHAQRNGVVILAVATTCLAIIMASVVNEGTIFVELNSATTRTARSWVSMKVTKGISMSTVEGSWYVPER